MENKEHIVELTALQEFAGDDKDILNELIAIFLRQTPVILEGMNKAIEQNDWFTASRQAHKLKPSLSTMGMENERNLAVEIEKDCEAGEITSVKSKADALTERCSMAMEELKRVMK